MRDTTDARYAVLTALCLLPAVLGSGCVTPGTAGRGAEAAKPPLPAAEATELCLSVADTMEKTGRFAEAAGQLEKARSYNPKLELSHRLATLYARAGDAEHARAEFEVALAAKKPSPGLFNDVGYFYYNQGDWTGAEKYLRLAVEKDPQNGRAWNNLGEVLAAQGRYGESLEAFTKGERPADAHASLAFLLYAQGKRAECREECGRALELEPNHGRVQVLLQKLDEAEKK
jgi:Tfp pilus assembly protein PilF